MAFSSFYPSLLDTERTGIKALKSPNECKENYINVITYDKQKSLGKCYGNRLSTSVKVVALYK